MLENSDSAVPNHGENTPGSVSEYLQRAATACTDGDAMLGIHLYLTAFEEDMSDGKIRPCDGVISGLKKAWALACMQKERSLAEYIFEKMEPYLSSDEIEVCAGELQDLALDKLEEFGLSRDDLEDMAEMISQDFLGIDARIVQVEHIVEAPSISKDDYCDEIVEVTEDAEVSEDAEASEDVATTEKPADSPEKPIDLPASVASENDSNDTEKHDAEKHDTKKHDAKKHDTAHDVAVNVSQLYGSQRSADSADNNNANHAQNKGAISRDSARKNMRSAGKAPISSSRINRSAVSLPENPMEVLARAVDDAGSKFNSSSDVLDYGNVVGYDTVIQSMHDLGIGMRNDENFQNLVGLLNSRHGLERIPALDTLLFRAPVREDANRFVAATLGELKLPVLRMNVEENFQCMPVLCITTQAKNAPKLNSMRTAFEGGGVLVLENIDTWGLPVSDLSEEMGNFLMLQMSRGAREAINLIRSAVENPDVYVFVTASNVSDIDDFFLDMLEPLSFVDIDYPTAEERVAIWEDIAYSHPSLRGISRADLVRLSANMPRFDMYMAAREAVEDAYKQGLVERRYCSVTRENLFDKLASYQPLESREYHELEDAVIRDFRSELDNIDDLLDNDE